MIRRIIIVLVLTGAGQLFSIFALKYISRQNLPGQLSAIAETDALIQLMISIIAFGLQSAAIRNLSITEDWEKEYENTQSARLTLGLLMLVLCLLFFTKHQYLVFGIAPILALSGDYALYARGHAIIGSSVAFVRVFIPFSVLLVVLHFFPDLLAYAYCGAIVLVYILTNMYISFFLKVKLFQMPRIGSINLYLRNLPLGVVTFSYYFLGLGLLLLANYMFDNKVIAIAYVSLKFYVIYKGVLRVIHQAFVKDMLRDTVCLQIDQLSSLAGILFLGSVLIFPDAFISIFFGKQLAEHRYFFTILAFSALTYSLFLSTTTKALLEKRDLTLAKIMVSAVSISSLSLIILSFFTKNLNCISVSLFTGEIVSSFFMARQFLSGAQVLTRLRFLFKNTLLLIFPLLIHFLFNASLNAYLSGIFLFSFLLAMLNYKKFKNLHEQPVLITNILKEL